MNTLGKVADAIMGSRPTKTTTGKTESSTETMFALVFHGKQDVRYEEVAKPIIVDATVGIQ